MQYLYPFFIVYPSHYNISYRRSQALVFHPSGLSEIDNHHEVSSYEHAFYCSGNNILCAFAATGTLPSLSRGNHGGTTQPGPLTSFGNHPSNTASSTGDISKSIYQLSAGEKQQIATIFNQLKLKKRYATLLQSTTFREMLTKRMLLEKNLRKKAVLEFFLSLL